MGIKRKRVLILVKDQTSYSQMIDLPTQYNQNHLIKNQNLWKTFQNYWYISTFCYGKKLLLMKERYVKKNKKHL
jgi:hypothetical protein